MNNIKTFSDKFIKNHKVLGMSILGIEFEFYSNHSFYKTLELLNLRLMPVNIHASSEYHSNINTDENNFKIEPDASLGPDGVELITGPLEYYEARNTIIKCLKFIRENGYTDDRCSIHLNISFKNKNMTSLNKLKLILDFNEDYIYEKFPDRLGNVYARSIKNIIPFKFWDNDITNTNILNTSIDLPDDTKYYGINIANTDRGWLEYRYVGGTNYENKTESILLLLDYFIIQTYNSIDVPMDSTHDVKLTSYLTNNMADYTNFKSYEDFIAIHDKILFTVDKNEDINLCRSYYDKCFDYIFNLFRNKIEGDDVIINYNTDDNTLEILNAKISGSEDINNLLMIDCEFNGCTITNCKLYDCDIKTSHIVLCNLKGSTVNESKVTECIISEQCELIDSFITGGSIAYSTITGGVFRQGKLLKGAIIDQSVRTDAKSDFWLNKPKGNKKDFKTIKK